MLVYNVIIKDKIIIKDYNTHFFARLTDKKFIYIFDLAN